MIKVVQLLFSLVALLFKKIMKTSTQWLFEKLWDEPKDKLTWYAILQQAMDMERVQIKNAYVKGQSDCEIFTMESESEQYYNETFKKK